MVDTCVTPSYDAGAKSSEPLTTISSVPQTVSTCSTPIIYLDERRELRLGVLLESPEYPWHYEGDVRSRQLLNTQRRRSHTSAIGLVMCNLSMRSTLYQRDTCDLWSGLAFAKGSLKRQCKAEDRQGSQDTPVYWYGTFGRRTGQARPFLKTPCALDRHEV